MTSVLSEICELTHRRNQIGVVGSLKVLLLFTDAFKITMLLMLMVVGSLLQVTLLKLVKVTLEVPAKQHPVSDSVMPTYSPF